MRRLSPHPGLPGRGLGNQYVTVCKVCNCGVYSNQAWEWSRRPLGIVHTECVVQP